MLWCSGVGTMEEFRAVQICVSEHQCEKPEQAGSLQEFRHSGVGGGFTAAFLAGEDNFLLHFKIYFYT